MSTQVQKATVTNNVVCMDFSKQDPDKCSAGKAGAVLNLTKDLYGSYVSVVIDIIADRELVKAIARGDSAVAVTGLMKFMADRSAKKAAAIEAKKAAAPNPQ
jgi:predicted transcriptional regulator